MRLSLALSSADVQEIGLLEARQDNGKAVAKALLPCPRLDDSRKGLFDRVFFRVVSACIVRIVCTHNARPIRASLLDGEHSADRLRHAITTETCPLSCPLRSELKIDELCIVLVKDYEKRETADIGQRPGNNPPRRPRTGEIPRGHFLRHVRFNRT